MLAAPLLLASLLTGLGRASASTPDAACHPGPVTQPVNPPDTDNQLNGVAVLSPCDVWVAGDTEENNGFRTLIEHWDGTSWTVVPSPHPGTFSELEAIRAFSPTSIFAVGQADPKNMGLTRKTLILHYNGTRWTTVRSPSPGFDNDLFGVRWVSAKDAWAVGTAFNRADRGKTLILRWNGTRWRRVTSPNPAADDELSGVAATSAKDAWAVGGTSGKHVHTFVLHWNGTAWKRVKSPSPAPDSGLSAIGLTSPASAWAVGVTQTTNSTDQTLALRWNGRTWATVATPAGPSGDVRTLTGVTAISSRDAWAVGADDVGGSGSNAQAIILHWNGSKWLPVALPGATPDTATELIAVAASSASNVWAVGDSGHGRQALVFHP
jgi:hypothetical protein